MPHLFHYTLDLRYNQGMFIVGMFSWWYGDGWRQRITMSRDNLVAVYDYFSLDLLVRTLFSPFRQISAGKVRGPLGVQVRALLDNLISRSIGGVVRLIVLVIGSITLLLSCLVSGLVIVVWPFVPILPLIGVVLAIAGWVPWTI